MKKILWIILLLLLPYYSNATVIFNDTFTDANGTSLSAHTADINTTGDVWHDSNNRFQIQNNKAQGVGGYNTDTYINSGYTTGKITWTFSESMNSYCYFVFKQNTSGSSYMYAYEDATNHLLKIYTDAGSWDNASWANAALNTEHTLTVYIDATRARFYEGSNLILDTPMYSYSSLTCFGLSYYSPSNTTFDNLIFDTDNSTPTPNVTATDTPTATPNYTPTVTPTAVTIYRSVGPANTTALATGTSNPMTISASTITFTNALPDNVGVGDAIQYDSNNGATIDSIAFISSRISSTQYTVKSAAGLTPTSVNSNQSWSLYRAYTCLDDSAHAYPNVAIDENVAYFDTWPNDLVTLNANWNIACYADAADNTPALVRNWYTDEDHYLKIYTPYLTSEVGTSQRHHGILDAGGYILKITNDNAFIARNVYLRFEGIQISLSGTADSGGYCFYNNGAFDDLQVSHCIFSAKNVDYNADKSAFNLAYVVLRAWDNIISDFTANVLVGYNPAIGYWIGDSEAYLYNNTIINCNVGIDTVAQYYFDRGTLAINNITQNCGRGYFAENITFTAGSDYNISDLTGDTTGGMHDLPSTTVTFVNPANSNYHLSPSDIGAKNKGTDLSADSHLPFSDDIDMQTRVNPWDIGADEVQDMTATPTATPTTTAMPTGTSTITQTATISPTQTDTSTITPTYTVTRTPTPTPTPKPPRRNILWESSYDRDW
jgi:hypothetical protein